MKHKVTFLAILLMALALPQSVFAYDFSAVAPSGQTLYYNIRSGGNATVISPEYQSWGNFTTPSGSLTIPASVTHNGYTYNVTSINDNAFKFCYNLTSVTIPTSVTYIGNAAFYYCNRLSSVTIPESVTHIGTNAFSHCDSLTSLTIPASVTNMGVNVFSNCSGLTSIEVSSDNTVYDSRNNCNAIIETASNTLIQGCKNTTIPNSVTVIGDFAFYNCIDLASVTIPGSVTSIGEYAFGGCTSLTSIIIPDGVTSIGNSAFYNVQHIVYHGTATGSPWGALSLNEVTDGDFVYSDPTKTTLIAYVGAGGDVVIPSTVTTIDREAFRGNTSITSVTIPNGVTSIAFGSFSGCTGLTSITLPEGLTSIGVRAFSGCTGLTHIILPSGLTSISSEVFSGCTNLSYIFFPNGLTSIGERAFSGCTGLSSITLPNSLTSIGVCAFESCTSLVSVILPNGLTSIGGSCFAGCIGLTSIAIPDGVTLIANAAFSNCTGLTSITLPQGLTAIDGMAFWNCTSLTNVTLPSNLTSIGESAFFNCSSLTNMAFHDGITYIGDYAFQSCTGLTSIIIPNGLTSISSYAFSGCTGLTSITLPNGLTTIGDYAFSGCTGLTSITLPDSLTTIGNGAFSTCNGLTSITIPDGVTSEYFSAFDHCSALTSIILPSGITGLSSFAFQYCTSLTSITLPEELRSIGDYAFADCTALVEIVSNATVPPLLQLYSDWGEPKTFRNVPQSVTVRVPCGSLAAYQTSRWGTVLSNFVTDCPNATLNAQAWYAISSPVRDNGGTTVSVDNVSNLTTGTYDLLRYDEAEGKWESQKAEGGQAGFSSLELGRGYIYRNSNDVTLTFEGLSNSGAINGSITHTCADANIRGFNLVGNPYDAAYAPTRDYYTLLPSGMWTAHTSSPSNTVAAGEAFFIYDNINDTYTFAESGNAKNAPSSNAASVALTVGDGDYSDVAYLRFDDGEGLPKMAHLDPEAPALSILQGDRRYAIACLDGRTASVPLHFSGYGIYTLSLSDNSLGLGYLHLVDREEGADIDLLHQPSYTFNATGADSERFTLRLNANAKPNSFVRVSDSRLIVDGDGELQVYDVMGRQLGSARVSGTTTLDRRALGMAVSGVYVVRLNGISQKIVVK